MSWLILINNQNYCIWSTSYSGTTVHRHSLSVRHRGRYLPYTRMTNINISYKYSHASHSSLNLISFSHVTKKIERTQKLVTELQSLRYFLEVYP